MSEIDAEKEMRGKLIVRLAALNDAMNKAQAAYMQALADYNVILGRRGEVEDTLAHLNAYLKPLPLPENPVKPEGDVPQDEPPKVNTDADGNEKLNDDVGDSEHQ